MPRRARLLFDSAEAGLVVGTRSVTCEERSLLFAAGALSVDMVLFPSAGGVHVAHGQVIDLRGERPVRAARVRLSGGGDTVETDRYGQFSVGSLSPFDAQSVQVATPDAVVHCEVPAPPVADGRPS